MSRPRGLGEILARKRELIARSDVHRRALAEASAGLAPAFAAGDRVAGVGRSLLTNPFVLVGGGVLLLVLWPRALFAAATRGFALWNGLRAARRLLGAER
jgi:hypothetical protein